MLLLVVGVLSWVVFERVCNRLGAGAREQRTWARVCAYAAACGGCLVLGGVCMCGNRCGPKVYKQRTWVRVCACVAAYGGLQVLGGVEVFERVLWAGAREQWLGRGCLRVVGLAVDANRGWCSSLFQIAGGWGA